MTAACPICLEAMEDEGRVRRVHGGAISMESRLEEAGFDTKTGLASKEKRLIAAEAVKLISSGDSIFLKSSLDVRKKKIIIMYPTT